MSSMALPTLPQKALARLERIPNIAGHKFPYLRTGKPAFQFKKLRQSIRDLTGHDLLGRARLLMPLGYRSQLPMLDYRSPHVRGDVFDIPDKDPKLALTPEVIDGQEYWRLFILSLYKGQVLELIDLVGNRRRERWFDFTEHAKELGFVRVPAYHGWRDDPRLMLWWHYQLADNLTWAECVQFIYGRHVATRPMRLALNDRTYGLGDRSMEVRNLQTMLNSIGLLDDKEIDSVFGLPTYQAVIEFQLSRKLINDREDKRAGVADPHTRRRLINEVLAISHHRKESTDVTPT